MKKIKLRNDKRFIKVRGDIARLVIKEKFNEAEKLAKGYLSPAGYEMIEEYKRFKKAYDKIQRDKK